MNKRAELPGASELFRNTHDSTNTSSGPAKARPEPTETTPSGASGRVKHDQKITVYFSDQELLNLEDANLELRREHGIRIDRGRLVRVALAVALRDFDERGEESKLVQELRD